MAHESHDSVAVVLTTTPSPEVAERLARALVDERLAACANVVPGVTSIYRWLGDVQREEEALMILKTRADRLDVLRDRLVELHPYDVPEVLAFDVRTGHDPYLAWVSAETAAE